MPDNSSAFAADEPQESVIRALELAISDLAASPAEPVTPRRVKEVGDEYVSLLHRLPIDVANKLLAKLRDANPAMGSYVASVMLRKDTEAFCAQFMIPGLGELYRDNYSTLFELPKSEKVRQYVSTPREASNRLFDMYWEATQSRPIRRPTGEPGHDDRLVKANSVYFAQAFRCLDEVRNTIEEGFRHLMATMGIPPGIEADGTVVPLLRVAEREFQTQLNKLYASFGVPRSEVEAKGKGSGISGGDIAYKELFARRASMYRDMILKKQLAEQAVAVKEQEVMQKALLSATPGKMVVIEDGCTLEKIVTEGGYELEPTEFVPTVVIAEQICAESPEIAAELVKSISVSDVSDQTKREVLLNGWADDADPQPFVVGPG